ncbi:MAG: glycosyltransferase [Pseudomonadota bacterium]|nr:glycosyltransferase [Pseudomonadota bacterium]
MISVIIRTKNEERWMRPCLEGVLNQKIDCPVEVVLVDNVSTDRTVERAIAVCPDLKLVEIAEFIPGLALNEGIRVSSGDYFVCLSAHCPPVDEYWLANLLENFSDPDVAGVYGRQVPTRFTSAVDKRDLLLTFGLDRRVQERDTFFHNANSMIRREAWERFPFDETITNIEDRIWGKQVIHAGYRIVYEPKAAVYHHHGIHQNNRTDRVRNVVRIMEEHMPEVHPDSFGDPLDPELLEVAVFIPLRAGENSIDFNEQLVTRTLASARGSRYVNRILVSTENSELASMACAYGAEVPFLRPHELAVPGVRVDEVLCHFLEQLENSGYFPDIVVPLEVTYPFRPEGLIDGIIEHLVREGGDSVIAGLPEYRACWQPKPEGFFLLTDIDENRAKRKPIHIGLPSLACALYPSTLREGTRLSGEVGIYEVHDPLASIEIRTASELNLLESRLKWKNHTE